MRSVTLVLLLGLQIPASALDFRGVQIGESCRHASEVELSLGATPRHDIEVMVSQGVVVFTDQSIAGQQAQFLYSCRQRSGVISQYSIHIRTKSESRAWKLYADAKSAAVSRLGAPKFDSEAPDMKEKMRQARIEGLVWQYAVANWTSVENQSVSLTLEKDPDDGEWSVATFVSKEPLESLSKPLDRAQDR